MPISHEVLRTAYSIGLILAGFIVSKSRKCGVICCMFCLAIPFFSIFFNEYAGAGISIWLINYLFTGFSSMYRACTYTYYARKRDSFLYLAPLGLIFGRLGEAGGSAIGIFSQDNSAFLIVVTHITFIISGVFLFIHYEQFYTSVPAIKTADVSSPEDILHAFRSKYNLTQREEDVLKLILDRKSNSQIAEELFVSENTVKFHVKNILSKTQTTKKSELVNKYYSE